MEPTCGLDVYNYRLRESTTTKMTAEEIQQTGLRKVAEIEGQMDGLLRQMGRTEGSLRTRIDKQRDDQPGSQQPPKAAPSLGCRLSESSVMPESGPHCC